MVKLIPGRQVKKFRRRPLPCGGFAVHKTVAASRVVTDRGINDLLDASLLPRRWLVYVQRVRKWLLQRGFRLAVNRIDAWRWHAWMPHTPLRVDSGLAYPLHRLAPVGSQPSCGFAPG